MDHEGFSARLRELRTAAGLTQQQLAEKSGLAQNSISNWEKGIREPAWSNVLALAEALGVTCEAFTQPGGPSVSQRRGRPAAKDAEASPPASNARKPKKGK